MKTDVKGARTPQGDEARTASGPVRVGHLDLRSDYPNLPAIPFWADPDGKPDPAHIARTEARLTKRTRETQPAVDGLTADYTIGGRTLQAKDFLFAPASSPLSLLPLEGPGQFTLPWTTYQNVYGSSQPLVSELASWLTDAGKATDRFWPTIATFGLAFNLLVLQKVDARQRDVLAAAFGDVWTSEGMDALYDQGRLYKIDMSTLNGLEPQTVDGEVRFTPGTITLLKQDPQSKALSPIAIKVASKDGPNRAYRRTDPAWLYALQAAKTSIAVYGIWLGHVYQWHIVTAAMQMAMFNTLTNRHRLWPLLSSQSDYLIDFDYVLLKVLWGEIAPPTPIAHYRQLLSLFDRFAAGRTFFDDDPTTTLKRLGLKEADFSVKEPWDAYPIVGFLLQLWKSTGQYARSVVDHLYNSEKEVADDKELEMWIAACGDPNEGNVRGLPDVRSRSTLAQVLTSLLYRVTVHGVSRLNPSANPVLTFMANFPPCLQSATIPDPGAPMPTKDLLAMRPHTGTLGKMASFYYIFVFSAPYVPLIPPGGINRDPYFPGPSWDPCNQALFRYRGDILRFIHRYLDAWKDAVAALSGGIPALPPYAEHQEHQWPRNIET